MLGNLFDATIGRVFSFLTFLGCGVFTRFWPLDFRFMGQADMVSGPNNDVGFRVGMQITKRVNTTIDQVYAIINDTRLELRDWQNPKYSSPWKEDPQHVIFGWIPQGNYAGKTLQVVMKHRWRTIRHRCLIGSKFSV